jgi:DNA-binding GntR family transcriptional regulator
MPAGALPNFARPGHRIAGRAIHDYLRRMILDGHLGPSAVLSQVAVAEQLGVSRTPVREALRKLEEEGLVASEINHRARVRPLDPQELDALYARRILAEALAVRLSVERFQPGDLRKLEALCQRMSKAAAADDFESWQASHREFHSKLVAPAGDGLKQSLRRYAERSERYLYMLLRQLRPDWWRRGEAEHREIFDCYRRADVSAAVNCIVRHLARTALQLSAMLAPDRAPVAVRAAVALLGAQDQAKTSRTRNGGGAPASPRKVPRA